MSTTVGTISIPPLYGLSIDDLALLPPFNPILLEGSFVYEKSTRFNRMRILGANGPILLSIPVKKSPKGTPLSDVHIDYIQKWQKPHWRSIQSAYGNSPFFQYYTTELEALFSQSPQRLIEFTGSLALWILQQYFPEKNLSVNLAQNQPHSSNSEIPLISPAEPENLSGSRFTYPQVFGQEFVHGLSGLDHLFCVGTKFWNLQN